MKRNETVTTRLRRLREKAGLSTLELANQAGLPELELARVEAGQHSLAGAELLRVASALGVDLGRLADPFHLGEELRFSWRARLQNPTILESFERKAAGWLGLFKTLSERQSLPVEMRIEDLKLHRRSSFEQVQNAAQAIRDQLGLGLEPAHRLEAALEECGIWVFFVDTPEGISGAACRLDRFGALLIQRREPFGRRQFNLAHELFHVLTWQNMPPKRLESDEIGNHDTRVEQLANNFASALLLPPILLKPRWSDRGHQEIHAWLNQTATELGVTAKALRWRLANLGWLAEAESRDLQEFRLTSNGQKLSPQIPRPLFGKTFVDRLYRGFTEGQISARRCAELLSMNLQELEDLFREHSLEPPFEV